MGEVSHSKPRHLSKADVAVGPRLSGCPLPLRFGVRGTRDGQRDFTALSTWASLHLQLSKPMGQASLSYLLLHNKFLHSNCLTQPNMRYFTVPGNQEPRHTLPGSSAQDLTRLHSGQRLGCILIWRLDCGSICFPNPSGCCWDSCPPGWVSGGPGICWPSAGATLPF